FGIQKKNKQNLKQNQREKIQTLLKHQEFKQIIIQINQILTIIIKKNQIFLLQFIFMIPLYMVDLKTVQQQNMIQKQANNYKELKDIKIKSQKQTHITLIKLYLHHLTRQQEYGIFKQNKLRNIKYKYKKTQEEQQIILVNGSINLMRLSSKSIYIIVQNDIFMEISQNVYKKILNKLFKFVNFKRKAQLLLYIIINFYTWQQYKIQFQFMIFRMLILKNLYKYLHNQMNGFLL
ncbi:hypothetical protein IMG5_167470, partial [Ichthyophthirius multifiliis]